MKAWPVARLLRRNGEKEGKMFNAGFLTVLFTLVLATGHLTLSPGHSATPVARVGEEVQAGQIIRDTHPDVSIRLFPQLSDADRPALVTSSDTWIRMANAPQAPETCTAEWKMDMSHQSWRCIDGVWQQITFEQWRCSQPQKVIDHTHQQRSQEACKTS